MELSTLLVLGAVGQHGATVREVATRLDIAHSTASRFITRAQEAGMVEREASAADKRVTAVTMTDGGRALERRATSCRLDRLATLTHDWPAEDVRDFAAATERFAARACHQ